MEDDKYSWAERYIDEQVLDGDNDFLNSVLVTPTERLLRVITISLVEISLILQEIEKKK